MESSSKDQKVLNIVYATDDGFVPFAGVSIYSLLYNNQKNADVNIYILDNNISETNKDLLRQTVKEFKCEIYFLDVNSCLKEVEKTGARDWSGSMSAYARLFISDFFSNPDIKRVLYLDCDTIVNGELTKLFSIDMGEYACAAVADYISAGIRLIDGLQLSDKYFNSGVLLIDIDRWNEHHCQKRIIQHMYDVRASYPYVDQDIINAVLHGDILLLPMQYNVFPYYSYFGFDEVCYLYDLNDRNHYSREHYLENLYHKEPIIIHYTKTFLGRPWEEGNHDELSAFWDKYYNLSIWKTQYQKQIFVSNPIAKLQYWGSNHMNKSLFMWIHRLFARINMRKMYKHYYNIER